MLLFAAFCFLAFTETYVAQFRYCINVHAIFDSVLMYVLAYCFLTCLPHVQRMNVPVQHMNIPVHRIPIA